MAEITVEALSSAFSDSPQIGHSILDQIGAILSGRNSTANARLRDGLWGRIEAAKELLSNQAEEIKKRQDTSDDATKLDVNEAGALIDQHIRGVCNLIQAFDSLALTKEITGIGVRKLDQAGSPDAARSVNRSSRRTKPPIIVDGELT